MNVLKSVWGISSLSLKVKEGTGHKSQNDRNWWERTLGVLQEPWQLETGIGLRARTLRQNFLPLPPAVSTQDCRETAATGQTSVTFLP